MKNYEKNYEFSNSAYINSWGKAPKGTGHWAFEIENAELPEIAPEVDIRKVSAYQKNTIFWVPGVWTLTEAKKRAAVMLAANGVPFGTTVYVAP